ncbi:hypothetical protein SDC9_173023 [bioreactor metagenome]|uniref:Uncharacterized protein n=1 Tax=bioreactor metagenome TaxID=1076179 RepID=A0A645GFB5_9ZZZZ
MRLDGQRFAIHGRIAADIRHRAIGRAADIGYGGIDAVRRDHTLRIRLDVRRREPDPPSDALVLHHRTGEGIPPRKQFLCKRHIPSLNRFADART